MLREACRVVKHPFYLPYQTISWFSQYHPKRLLWLDNQEGKIGKQQAKQKVVNKWDKTLFGGVRAVFPQLIPISARLATCHTIIGLIATLSPLFLPGLVLGSLGQALRLQTGLPLWLVFVLKDF